MITVALQYTQVLESLFSVPTNDSNSNPRVGFEKTLVLFVARNTLQSNRKFGCYHCLRSIPTSALEIRLEEFDNQNGLSVSRFYFHGGCYTKGAQDYHDRQRLNLNVLN